MGFSCLEMVLDPDCFGNLILDSGCLSLNLTVWGVFGEFAV